MRNINTKFASTLSGDSFHFPDIIVSIFNNIWDKKYIVLVSQTNNSLYTNDKKIASFSFDNLDDALEICDYVLAKIALANALFGWMN